MEHLFDTCTIIKILKTEENLKKVADYCDTVS